jgi:uncharacterized membrane protein YfcA
MDFLHPLSGFLVGTMVGLTGVGGGSLMAPIMILLLGVAPTTAVGTDLWFAALTKMVGGGVHHSQGHADWQVVRRLAYGSVPAAALTLWFLSASGGHQMKNGLVVQMLGAALIITAIVTLFQRKIYAVAVNIEGRSQGGLSALVARRHGVLWRHSGRDRHTDVGGGGRFGRDDAGYALPYPAFHAEDRGDGHRSCRSANHAGGAWLFLAGVGGLPVARFVADRLHPRHRHRFAADEACERRFHPHRIVSHAGVFGP